MPNLIFGTNLVPQTTETYALGTSDKKWTINGVSSPALTDTDTQVNVVLATDTKAYLLGTSTTPTSTATGTTAVADTGTYLTTTSGELNSTSFKVAEHVSLQYDNSDLSLNFIFS